MSKASVYASKAEFEKEFLPTNMPRVTSGWWDEESNDFYYHDEFLRGAFVCFQSLEALVEEQHEKYKVEIDGANDRCRLLFDAKNHWADRARAAEAELARRDAQEPIYQMRLLDGSAEQMEWVEVTSEEYSTPTKSHEWERRKVYAEPRPPVLLLPEGLHNDTADLVLRFAKAMAEKLHSAEKKYGHSNGWKSPAWYDECLQHLWEHVGKGDPRDVAAYCAFMWHHGWQTAEPRPAVLQEKCEWVWDDGDCFCQASCGGTWVFTDGSPQDNEVKFCQCCGKEVSIKAAGGEIAE